MPTEINYFNYIVSGLILTGSIVIAFSAFLTRKLFELLPNEKFRKNWKNLYLLMILFFFGYLIVAFIVYIGKHDFLELLTGVVFLLGGIFVFLVVRTGLKTFKEIQLANENLEEKVQFRTKEIQSKNEELQHFAYVVSHDLKAPLRGIETLAHFIEEDLKEGKKDAVVANLKTLKSRVNRMDGFIEGILDFSTIGMVEVSKERININYLFKEIIDLLKVQNFEFKIEGELPYIIGVKSQFFQLFSNLISNGIKFNDKKKGLITISYKDIKDTHEFSIEDNGPGIPEEYHSKIFVVFQTLQVRDSYESTGIGLSIVKKIVDKLGGSIQIKSKKNEGTAFIVRLPKSEL